MNVVEMPLRSGHVALIDEADLDLVHKYRWHAERRNNVVYVAHRISKGRHKNGPRIFLHRLLTGAADGQPVDHISGDGLDNRRANLRICSVAENVRNQHVKPGRFKGVSVTHGRFQARAAGRFIGTYQSAIEAALAYDQAAKQMFGEFARLNFLDDVPVGLHADDYSSEIDKWIPTRRWNRR